MDLSAYIRDIPDWPKEGVVFKDITPLLASPEGFRDSIDTLADAYATAGVTKVMGAEARGFIFGAHWPIAWVPVLSLLESQGSFPGTPPQSPMISNTGPTRLRYMLTLSAPTM